MASIFVEYAASKDAPGYSEGPLGLKVGSQGVLDFMPKKRYQNRRVEELTTEEAAVNLVNRFRRQGLFRICKDLMASQDLSNIEKFVQLKMAPLVERIESLEEQIALMKKSKRTAK